VFAEGTIRTVFLNPTAPGVECIQQNRKIEVFGTLECVFHKPVIDVETCPMMSCEADSKTRPGKFQKPIEGLLAVAEDLCCIITQPALPGPKLHDAQGFYGNPHQIHELPALGGEQLKVVHE
jgi:hypothetical protein